MSQRVTAIRKVWYNHKWYRPGAVFEADADWVVWALSPKLRAPGGLVRVLDQGAAEPPPPSLASTSGDDKKKTKAQKTPEGGDK